MMNFKQSYYGLRATFRSMRTKLATLTSAYQVLESKYTKLASDDPILAELIDANHRLSVDLRTVGSENEQLKVDALHDASRLHAIRAAFIKQREHTRLQQKQTLYWAIAFAVQAVAVAAAGVYVWLV
jgi:hypothetical protein